MRTLKVLKYITNKILNCFCWVGLFVCLSFPSIAFLLWLFSFASNLSIGFDAFGLQINIETPSEIK